MVLSFKSGFFSIEEARVSQFECFVIQNEDIGWLNIMMMLSVISEASKAIYDITHGIDHIIFINSLIH
jgi:hypothetical protein